MLPSFAPITLRDDAAIGLRSRVRANLRRLTGRGKPVDLLAKRGHLGDDAGLSTSDGSEGPLQAGMAPRYST